MSMAMALEAHYSVTGLAESAAPEAALAPQALIDKFQATMEHASPYAAQSVHHGERVDVVSRAIQDQADYYRMVPNDVVYMAQHASTLPMEKLAAADMTVQLELASLNADMQVKMATVQSSKDSVQTLMKNQ
ncbi:serine kinase [Burkholderia sp. Ac-20384]|uniref:serine kinase n=1 Tax=Burkholderia sp. Ac-20384 TaxID=2703902 RepID=UPI00197FBB33|nr:serine kinase [Burkholderia sp. Ac-20384]MBN3825128.1 serine kinase [Burkholderia sp. Ac-20384]